MSDAIYRITPIVMSVHQRGDNPIFGESCVHVSVLDEAAGPFLSLKSNEPDLEPGEIKIEYAQLDAIAQAAADLMSDFTEDVS